jgi:ferredoxin--NADP+ reductase
MFSTHLKPSSQRKVMVMHGVRHSWDLGYRSILMAMQNLRGNFSYLPVVSRPQEEPVKWKGSTGRVQDQWKKGAVEKAWGFKPTPENTHVFLCGSPGMVQEMTGLLEADGFAEQTKAGPGQIHASRYWHK